MKKAILILNTILCLILSQYSVAQKDTSFADINGHFVYSKKYKVALVVYYKLWKGGGDCNRSQFRTFKEFDWTAKNSDFNHQGDKGHLINAEDRAHNCKNDSATFACYNIILQSANLNRGVFKINETKVRELSQYDSLGIFYINIPSMEIFGNGVHKVIHTYKVVQSLSTGRVYFCIRFSDNPGKVEDVKLGEVYSVYPIKLKGF